MNSKVMALLAAGLVVIAWIGFTRSKTNVVAPPVSSLTSEEANSAAAPPPGEAPHISKPRIAAVAPVDAPSDPKPTNLYARLVNGDVPKLSPEQLDAYLKENQHSAESLLAAFRASSDTAFLKEAVEKFPNDPRVAYAALFKADSPEERKQWLDRLKQNAPENALPNYFSALDALKSGQTDRAIQEITAASGKQQFQDYTVDFFQNVEEAYRSAGYSAGDAKTIAATQLLLPDLAELRQLSKQMVGLANSYQQAGDTASADAALRMNLTLGQRFGGYPGEPLIDRLVGIAIERDALVTMDPTSAYGTSGQTVQDRLSELDKTKQSLKSFAQQEDGLFAKMSDSDVVSYWDRWRTFGYQPTMQWALSKYGQQTGVNQ